MSFTCVGIRGVQVDRSSVKKTIISELRRFEKEKAVRDAWRQQAISESQMRNEVFKPVLDAAKADMEKLQQEDYQRRRKAQLAEVQARIDREKKELLDRLEKESVERRIILKDYWGQKSIEYSEEVSKLRKEYIKDINNDYQDGINSTFDEWAKRDYHKARIQVEAPGYENNHDLTYGLEKFGIFGKSGRVLELNAQGTELPDSELGDEFKPDIDAHDVHLFSSEPNILYENKNILLLEAESKYKCNQKLYDALQFDSKALGESIERMCQMRDMLERDIYQTKQEFLLDEADRLIPPKRLPNPAEVDSIHYRKERISQLQRKIADFQYSINIADDRKRNADMQLLNLAKLLAVNLEETKRLESDMKTVNGENLPGMLPMVIGRSLSVTNGLNVHSAHPKEFYDAVTHQSRYIELNEIGKSTISNFKQRNSTDQQIWLDSMLHNGLKADVDRVMK